MGTEPKDWSFGTPVTPEAREKAAAEFADAQMSLSTPHGLMSSLRGILKSGAGADTMLNDILSLLARELRADICSCFVVREGQWLELYASHGLSPEIIGREKLPFGAGILGEMAQGGVPAILSDVAQHPAFLARPETGDGKFMALCGVPVLRDGRVLGLLILQNKHPRLYGDAVTDIVQTVSMVVAEILSRGILSRRLPAGEGSEKPGQINGVSLARGLAVGTVVLYQPGVTQDNIFGNILADDARAEKKRLAQALSVMHDSIDRMLNRDAAASNAESRDILEAYKMFARDRGWLARIESAIDKGLTAEAAVQRVQNETRARMQQVKDNYIRERMQDIEDLGNRLLSHLSRREKGDAPSLPDNIILVARAMGPAALLDYDSARLKGVILERGSHSNHVAIVARSLGIPVVGQCADICGFATPGEPAIVDGDNGVVYLSPSAYVSDLYAKSIETRARRAEMYRQTAHKPAVTADGAAIAVLMNAGLVSEMENLQTSGAEGVGLFRTELSFMTWQQYPSVATQAELYGRVMDRAGDKPVVFRTLDVGSDKPLPYIHVPHVEENPALGWRALRIALDRPAILRTQYRAMIDGARGRPLKIMLPFVTDLSELDRARSLLDIEKRKAVQRGRELPAKIELGVMLEVPSLLFQLDGLLSSVDFVSVGTNDLMQYLYAADRGNFAVRGRYDPLSPAMLRVLGTIAEKCRAAGVPVSVCGEMAGNPLEALALLGLGFTTLSAPAQSVQEIKGMIPSVDLGKLMPYLQELIDSRAASVRDGLLSFARAHKINIMQPTDHSA